MNEWMNEWMNEYYIMNYIWIRMQLRPLDYDAPTFKMPSILWSEKSTFKLPCKTRLLYLGLKIVPLKYVVKDDIISEFTHACKGIFLCWYIIRHRVWGIFFKT